jgi:hypothetical protein
MRHARSFAIAATAVLFVASTPFAEALQRFVAAAVTRRARHQRRAHAAYVELAPRLGGEEAFDLLTAWHHFQAGGPESELTTVAAEIAKKHEQAVD